MVNADVIGFDDPAVCIALFFVNDREGEHACHICYCGSFSVDIGNRPGTGNHHGCLAGDEFVSHLRIAVSHEAILEISVVYQLQQAVSELVEADLVEMSSQSNRSYYRLTSEGKNTLKYFSKELSSDIKKEVEEYLNSLHCKIEEHLLTPADYYPTKEGSYSVRLRIIESGVSIVDLSINVPNLAAAQSVCESWPYKYQNVYDKIMEELL